MSVDRNADTIFKIGQKLEKLTPGDDSDGEIYDALKALENLPMTIQILRDTKIGIIVNKLKKSLPDETDANSLAKSLIQSWKRVQAESQKEPSSTSSSPRESVSTSSPRKSATEEDDALSRDSSYSKLSATSKKVVDLITDRLKLSTDDASLAQQIAVAVEAELSTIFEDTKSYNDKFRSIVTNLKTNADLRVMLIKGKCNAHQLVTMRPEDLASEEVRQKRLEAVKLDGDTRRTDIEFLAIQREKVMKSLGLKEVGGFTCNRCKSTKTTYHEQQTRSADEPMTVFIKCLECGAQRREG